MGISVPKLLQPSTLACPPSLNYIKQFIPDVGQNGILTNYKSKKKNYYNFSKKLFLYKIYFSPILKNEFIF